MLDDCSGNKWKMCIFLKTFFGNVMDVSYAGQMLPSRVTMITRKKIRFDLGTAITFYGGEVISEIDSRDGSDLLSFRANLFLQRTFDMVPGDSIAQFILLFSRHFID